MITTGIKLYAAYLAAALLGAVVYGYTTGGSHVGPLTLGYKGAVGDQVGYGILVGLAVGSAVLVVASAAFRDADATAAAELLGTDGPPAPQRPVAPSLWPVLGALGAAATVVGLVAHPAIFVIGLVVLAITAVEWMMEAWADRATGDPAVNRELRNRVMQPIEIPALAFGGIAILVLAVSRILLATSKEAAVWIAVVVAAVIFGLAIILSRVRHVPRSVVGTVLFVGIFGLIAGGVVAAAVGEREFEPHVGHDEHEESPLTDDPGTGDSFAPPFGAGAGTGQ